jgi:hypothetical protein
LIVRSVDNQAGTLSLSATLVSSVAGTEPVQTATEESAWTGPRGPRRFEPAGSSLS